jgi:hypothetical protein
MVTVDGVPMTMTLGIGSYSATLPVPSGNFYIGGSVELGRYLNGWLDEFRISKGIARWTDAFLPPTEAYTNDTVTPGITLSTVCSFEPENIFQRWDATYDCITSSWVLSASPTTSIAHGWFDSETGKYCTVRGYLLPDTGDLTPPTCYFWWNAVYSCITSTWTVSYASYDLIGPAMEWTDMMGMYMCITTTAVQPDPPLVAPTCYYSWSSAYSCETYTWSAPNLDYVDTFGWEMPWQVFDYSANCVTLTSTPPDLPTDVPICPS